MDRLLSHIDPWPAEESEAFVHLIRIELLAMGNCPLMRPFDLGE
jgi:hypothetical protein